jgi:pimeloyl-ACP methyl ester carboxylesterase
MHYETYGDGNGPAFVWLHGWGHNHSAFSRLAQLFTNHGIHYLFDLPGFGKSPMLPKGAGTQDYADGLAAVLDTITDGPCILIGHSFGARVAVQMAVHHASRVKAIILISGAGLQRKRSISYKIRAFSLRSLGKVARLCDTLFKSNLRQIYSSKFGSADYKAAGELRPTFVRVVSEDLVNEAKSATCPALLLYGSQDTETPPELGHKYEALMQDAQYHELAGFGHNDILDRGAYQCQALITDFLKSLKQD